MRNRLFVIMVVSVLGCASDTEIENSLEFTGMGEPQKWILTELNLGLSGELIDAATFNLTEAYYFMPDGTFTKEFENDNTRGNSRGTYELLIINDMRRLIELNFSGEVGDLSYCAQENTETLRISVDNKSLVNGYCLSFDGPALYYARVE